MTFREILAECLEGRSQSELAGMLGITQAHVSRLLAGERGPGVEVLRSMAEAFPEKKDALVSLFFASEDPNRSEKMTSSMPVSEQGR